MPKSCFQRCSGHQTRPGGSIWWNSEQKISAVRHSAGAPPGKGGHITIAWQSQSENEAGRLGTVKGQGRDFNCAQVDLLCVWSETATSFVRTRTLLRIQNKKMNLFFAFWEPLALTYRKEAATIKTSIPFVFSPHISLSPSMSHLGEKSHPTLRKSQNNILAPTPCQK